MNESSIHPMCIRLIGFAANEYVGGSTGLLSGEPTGGVLDSHQTNPAAVCSQSQYIGNDFSVSTQCLFELQY